MKNINHSFISFVKSLSRFGNESLIESVVEGYNVIFEADTFTDNLRKWFDGSKVVDSSGNPMIVYHGTTASPFNTFVGKWNVRFEEERGTIYFTDDKDIASGYGSSVYACYLKMLNPLEYDANGQHWTTVNWYALSDALSGGHDGVILKNVLDTPAGKEERTINTYIVFNSSQIKSATNNNGMYNPQSNNIFESSTPTITLYRGLTQHFNPEHDTTTTDAPNGYSTWTDNPELAKQYAGPSGYVYKIELPLSEMGDEYLDIDGDRVLFFNNENKAGLNGVKGNEFLIYTDHELYNPNSIKLVNNKIMESINSNVRYIDISDDMYDVDEDINELLEQVDSLVSRSSINVLRGKDLKSIAVIGETVVGALFTEFSNYEFSFDVVVDTANQSSGIGKELTNIAMAEYDMYSDMDGVRLVIDVVNPRYAEYLQKQYSLSIESESHGHIILSDKPETSLNESVQYESGYDAIFTSNDYSDIINSHTIKELENYDWDKIAFGISNDDIITIPLSKLKIKWKDDMLNVNGYDMKQYFKNEPFDNLPPIDVSFNGKSFFIEDGHHRYAYAKQLGLKNVKVRVDITANPFNYLGFTMDDVVNYKNTSAITESTDTINSPILDKAVNSLTLEDRIIAYLDKIGSNVYNVPTDPKLKELLVSASSKYVTPDRINRMVEWTEEYDGMTIDELKQSSIESKEYSRNMYIKQITDKLNTYNAAKDFVHSKDPSLNIEIPSIDAIVNSVVNAEDDPNPNTCVIYVYKGNDEYDSIGLLVNIKDKTIDIFEENEESNQATISAVTALTKDPDEYVKVFSSQPTSIIDSIERSHTVPKGMFVSPDISYAKGYLQENRDIISFDIQYKYINPHSPYDWQINADAPIKQFKYI